MLLDFKKYKNEDKINAVAQMFKKEFVELTSESFCNFRDYYKNNIDVNGPDNRIYDIDFIDNAGENSVESDWWGFKLFDREDIERVDPYTRSRFSKTIELLLTMPNVARAHYTSVGPGSFVPPHIDTIDHNEEEPVEVVNFLITIHAEGDITLRSEDQIVTVKTDNIYCIDAYHREHEGKNNSDGYWIIFALQINREIFL